MTNKEFITAAGTRLKNAAYSPKKLIFIHAGLTALALLLYNLSAYLLTNSMDAAAGLSGLDTRTALSFIRTLLLIVVTVLLPFWELGYLRSAVLYARDETPTPRDLLQGFHRFFPALRLMLLRTVAIGALLIASAQASSFLYTLTPFGQDLMRRMESLLLTETVLTEELLKELLRLMTPVYILWAAVALAGLIWLFYRYRFADLALMNDAQGARASLRASRLQTRGRRLQLFKLDLHFWWYYALLLLAAAISYLDVILPKLGLVLNEDVWIWVFFLCSQLLTLIAHILFTPKVQTTYASFLVEN